MRGCVRARVSGRAAISLYLALFLVNMGSARASAEYIVGDLKGRAGSYFIEDQFLHFGLLGKLRSFGDDIERSVRRALLCYVLLSSASSISLAPIYNQEVNKKFDV